MGEKMEQIIINLFQAGIVECEWRFDLIGILEYLLQFFLNTHCFPNDLMN